MYTGTSQLWKVTAQTQNQHSNFYEENRICMYTFVNGETRNVWTRCYLSKVEMTGYNLIIVMKSVSLVG